MKEKLVQYIELLFAGAKGSEEIKQEILQNTLDRYDDLIAEGRSPETAYRMAISGIGDINEILSQGFQASNPAADPPPCKKAAADSSGNKLLRAFGIGLYMVSLVPLIILSEFNMPTLGFSILIGICAVATVLMILGAKGSEQSSRTAPQAHSQRKELCKSVCHTVWVIALVLFFLLSFLTRAWLITWLIFPVAGAVQGLIKAFFDLKEATDHET